MTKCKKDQQVIYNLLKCRTKRLNSQ